MAREIPMQQLATTDRLKLHYDVKYAGADWRAIKPIPLLKNPTIRTENAVAIAAQFGGGSYLEIGASLHTTILGSKVLTEAQS
jgi:hypothetical protein